MGRTFQQLSLEERERMYALREQGKSFRQIGIVLRRDHRTVAREYRRNRFAGQEYVPCKAEEQALVRQREQRTHAPLKTHFIFVYVRQKLREEGLSPEAIAGRLQVEHPGQSISPETIYGYIYGKGKEYQRWEHLTRRQKKRRMKTGRDIHANKPHSRIPGAVSIEKRSTKVNNRSQAGNWETDVMEGRRGYQCTLSVTVERKTRYVILGPIQNKKAETMQKALQKRLKNVQSWERSRNPIVRSITSDNGSENVRHRELSQQLKADWYFCHPYHSWEKGTVENTIGRIRR